MFDEFIWLIDTEAEFQLREMTGFPTISRQEFIDIYYI
jgi:hypothetical protein